MLNSLRSLWIISLAVIICQQYAESRRVDCRKYIFAPKCRGIAAKRDGGDSALRGLQTGAREEFHNRLEPEQDMKEMEGETNRGHSLLAQVLTSSGSRDRNWKLAKTDALRSRLYPYLFQLNLQLRKPHRSFNKPLSTLQTQWLQYMLGLHKNQGE